MMYTVGLGTTGANLDIVGEASLSQISTFSLLKKRNTYSHSRVQRPGHFIVLLKPWTTSQNLGKPELVDGALHVGDLALRRSRGFHPLRRFPSHTAHQVRMCEGLWCSGLHFDVQRRRDWLSDPAVKRRRPTWDR
jgi:hypothetical protein